MNQRRDDGAPQPVDLSPFLLEISPARTSAEAAASASALLRSAARFGYAHVSNHGIPEEKVTRLLDESRAFFSARAAFENAGQASAVESNRLSTDFPDATVSGSLALSPTTYRGYQRVGENVTGGARDAHRALDYIRSLGPDAACLRERPVLAGGESLRALACGQNVFPGGGMEDAVHSFMEAAVDAGRAVVRAVCFGLGVEESALGSAFADPFHLLRLIHYPGLGERDSDAQMRDGRQKSEELGCGGHRDYGCVTFIVSSEEPGTASALEVSRRGSDGVETYVPAVVPPRGSMLLNFGDCLECLTAGILPATLHRVVRPTRDRISIAAFVEPTFSWPIAPIRALDRYRIGLAHSEQQPLFASTSDQERFKARLAELQSFSCYGSYLLSKVSNNFVLYERQNEEFDHKPA